MLCGIEFKRSLIAGWQRVLVDSCAARSVCSESWGASFGRVACPPFEFVSATGHNLTARFTRKVTMETRDG
eukprot:3756498-Amphidinium_carterae.1